MWDTTANLPQRVRDAFCIIADPSIIPPTARKGASKCWGLLEDPRKLSDVWPEWEDVSNDVYNQLIEDVIWESRNAPPHSTRQPGLAQLWAMKKARRAEVIEAYLAALRASSQLVQHMHRKPTLWRPDPWDEVSHYVEVYINTYFRGR